MSSNISRKKRGQRDNKTLLIGGGIVAVVVVALLLLLNTNLNARPYTPPIAAAGKTWGNANAPVTIEEYFDFQCPVCGRAAESIQQIASKYLDTGKAKVIARHFAFIGQESQWAAEAAECAGEQNKFWVFAEYVFSHQAGENAGAFSKDNLKGFAKQVGLETTAFNACLDSGKYTDAVKQETQTGQQRGIRATPTFFINGQQKIEGYLTPEQFGTLIDSLQK